MDLVAGERHLDQETCVRRLADQAGNIAIGGFRAKPIPVGRLLQLRSHSNMPAVGWG